MSNTVVTKAIELTEKYGWNKHDYAQDKDGNYTDTFGEEACTFCALGFLGRAKHELGEDENYGLNIDAEQLVAQFVPEAFCGNIAAFNDHPSTTKQDIIDLFKKANEK